MNKKSALVLVFGIILFACFLGLGYSAYGAGKPAEATSAIVLVFDQDIAVSSSASNYVYLTSFDTSGFENAYIMAKAEGTWQEGANVNIWIYENNFGVRTAPSGGFGGFIQLATGSDTYKPDYGCGQTPNSYQIHSSSNDLYLQVYNSDVGLEGHLTIVAYLTK